MKFLLIAFALIGLAASAQLPDSATQGPNPQDIATPEPEYIDIDVPEPAAAAAAVAPAPLPAPVQARSFAPVSLPVAHPVQRPIISAPIPSISQQYLAPQRSVHVSAPQYQLPGHSFSSQSGYQYRRPVYIRRVYRRRRY